MANNEYLLGAGVKDDKWTPINKNKAQVNTASIAMPDYSQKGEVKQSYTPTYDWVHVGTPEENAIKALKPSTSSFKEEDLASAAKNVQHYNDSNTIQNVGALFSNDVAKTVTAKKRGQVNKLVEELNKNGVSATYNANTDVITYKDKYGLTHKVDASTTFLETMWATKFELLGAVAGGIFGSIAGAGAGGATGVLTGAPLGPGAAVTGAGGAITGALAGGAGGSAVGAGMGNWVDQQLNYYNSTLDITTEDGKKKAINLAMKKTIAEEVTSAINAATLDVIGSGAAAALGKGLAKVTETKAGRAAADWVKDKGNAFKAEAKDLGADVISLQGMGKNAASVVAGGVVSLLDPVAGVATAIGTRAALHKNIISMGTAKGIGTAAATGFLVDPVVGAIAGTLVKMASRNSDYAAKVFSEAKKMGGNAVNDLANSIKNAGADGVRVAGDITEASKLDYTNMAKLNDKFKTALKNTDGLFTDMDIARYEEISKLVNNTTDLPTPSKQVLGMILGTNTANRLMKSLAKHNAEKANHLQTTLGYFDDFIRQFVGRPLNYNDTVVAAHTITKSITDNAKGIFDGLAANEIYGNMKLSHTLLSEAGFADERKFLHAANMFYSRSLDALGEAKEPAKVSSRIGKLDQDSNAFTYVSANGLGQFTRKKTISSEARDKQDAAIYGAVDKVRTQRKAATTENDDIYFNDILTAIYDASFSMKPEAKNLLNAADSLLEKMAKVANLDEGTKAALLGQVSNVNKALASVARFKGRDFYAKLLKVDDQKAIPGLLVNMMSIEDNGSKLLPMYLNALKVATSHLGGDKVMADNLLKSAEWIAIDNAVNAFVNNSTPTAIDFRALSHTLSELPFYTNEAKAFSNMISYLADLLPNKSMLQKASTISNSGNSGAKGAGIGYNIFNRLRTMLTTGWVKKIVGFTSNSPEAILDRLSKQLAATIANPDEAAVRNRLNEVFETMMRRLPNEEAAAFSQAKSGFDDAIKNTIVNPDEVVEVAPTMPKADISDLNQLVKGLTHSLGDTPSVEDVGASINSAIELGKKSNTDINEELVANLLANNYNMDVEKLVEAANKVRGTEEAALNIANKEQGLTSINAMKEAVEQTSEEIPNQLYSDALFTTLRSNIDDLAGLEYPGDIELALSIAKDVSKQHGVSEEVVYNDIQDFLATKASAFNHARVELPSTLSEARDAIVAAAEDKKPNATINHGEQATKSLDEIDNNEPVDTSLTTAVEKNIATKEMKEAIDAISKKLNVDKDTRRAVFRFREQNVDYMFSYEPVLHTSEKVKEIGEAEATKIRDNLEALAPLAKGFRLAADIYTRAIDKLKAGELDNYLAKNSKTTKVDSNAKKKAQPEALDQKVEVISEADIAPKFSDFEIEHINAGYSKKNPLAQLGEFFRFTPTNHISILDTHASNALADVLAYSKDPNYNAMDWISNPGKRTHTIKLDKLTKELKEKSIYDTKMNYKTPWLKKLSKDVGIADTRTYGEFINTFYEPLNDLAKWLKDNHNNEFVPKLGKLMEDATQGASGVPAGTIGPDLTAKEVHDYYEQIRRSVVLYDKYKAQVNSETLSKVFNKSKELLRTTEVNPKEKEGFEALASVFSTQYQETFGNKVGADTYGAIVARMFRDDKLKGIDKDFDHFTKDIDLLSVEVALEKAMTAPWIRYPERKMTGLYAAARHLAPEVLRYSIKLNISDYFEYGPMTRMLDSMANRKKFVEAFNNALKEKPSIKVREKRLDEMEKLRKDWKSNPELEGRYIAYKRMRDANRPKEPMKEEDMPF